MNINESGSLRLVILGAIICLVLAAYYASLRERFTLPAGDIVGLIFVVVAFLVFAGLMLASLMEVIMQ